MVCPCGYSSCEHGVEHDTHLVYVLALSDHGLVLYCVCVLILRGTADHGELVIGLEAGRASKVDYLHVACLVI